MQYIQLISLGVHLLSVYSLHEEFLTCPRAHVAALVLARGGSKGIPMKNLARIGNESLLGRALRVIHEVKKFHSVWVSTDSEKIAQEGRMFKAQIHYRQNFTATDEASSILAVQEFLDLHPEVHILALIQCTSPFIKPNYLTSAFEVITSGAADSVFSVVRRRKLRWSIDSRGFLQPANFNSFQRPRRQDMKGELYENGMFYFSRADLIKQSQTLQSGRVKYVEVSEEDSLEIDTPHDLMLTRCIDPNEND